VISPIYVASIPTQRGTFLFNLCSTAVVLKTARPLWRALRLRDGEEPSFISCRKPTKLHKTHSSLCSAIRECPAPFCHIRDAALLPGTCPSE
ncbi:hypothetical protein P7K49_018342, partial [Saguinus oedipus]